MAPAKKAKAKDSSKAAAKAAKKDKQASKQAKKDAQAIKGKGKGKDDEEDLEDILERFQEEWQQAHAITEENQSEPPSRRANASFTPCPSGNHLWLIGGEVFDGERATFFNDTYRYSPDKNEWRLYTSPTAPAPRSAHAVVALPTDGGQLLLFGGEYASPSQTSFHHYRDLWLFSIKTHAWEKIETKVKPTARSGHRMVLWKHYVILFGGFIDVGVKTNYLSDLWIFNTEEYKWKQIEMVDKDRCPGPRSGFSFIPCAEGAILHGGYRKEYVKGNRPKGLPLEDTWLLKMDPDLSKLKWERRRKAGYAPSLRSGCSMTYWASKQMGVLFGGVFDEEKDEESMESIFYNDMFAYNPAGNGRWMSLNLKKRKKMGGKKRVKKIEPARRERSVDEDDEDVEMADGDEEDVEPQREASPMVVDEEEDDPDDPLKTVPLTRYNAMLAVLKNTLYIYGGIYETAVPAREYTLDDFITLNLEKLDKFNHIRGSGLEDLEWKGSDDEGGGSDSDDDDSDDERRGREEDEEDEESEDDGEDIIPTDDEDLDEEERERRHAALTQKEKDALRASATKFLGVSKDATRSQEEVLQTPQPSETLRLFFERSREYWVGTAFSGSSNRGKALRREAFKLAADKYEEYKPLLEEIERIQREAEVTAADSVKRGPAGTGEGGRNRRWTRSSVSKAAPTRKKPTMPPKGWTKAAAAAAKANAQTQDSDTANGSPPPPVNAGPMTAAQKQAAPYMAGLHDFELPKSVIQRLAKSALPDNFKMQQEVTPALLRSSTVFISYLTAAAHEVALARGAKSVTANDIMNATEIIEFGPPDEIRPILEKELAAFRAITAGKKSGRPSTGSTVGRRPSMKGKGKAGAADGEGEGEGEGDEDNEMAVDDEAEQELEGEAEAEAEDEPEDDVQEEDAPDEADVEMNGGGDALVAETNGMA